MSVTEQNNLNKLAVAEPLSAKDLASVLVKHYKLAEGLYSLLVEYQIGTGGVGPNKDSITPGVMIGVCRIGLTHAETSGPNTVDASVVNAKAMKKIRSAKK